VYGRQLLPPRPKRNAVLDLWEVQDTGPTLRRCRLLPSTVCGLLTGMLRARLLRADRRRMYARRRGGIGKELPPVRHGAVPPNTGA